MAARRTRRAPLQRPGKPNAREEPGGRSRKRSASSPRVSAKQRGHARDVYAHLLRCYPDARCALDHRNPFELLVATILSAQCTDVRVNMVTPALFGRYGTPRKMAAAAAADLEELIRSTGFYRNKTKSIKGASATIVAEHGGHVPRTMDALLQLPGVARKTANVVLGNAFGVNDGVVVDTHVARLSKRLGLTRRTDPVHIERDLMKRFAPDTWTMLAHLLIFHGRQVCGARRPRCDQCALADICPKVGVKQ